MSNSQARKINIHGMVLQFAYWFAICTYFSFIIATLVDNDWTAGDATLAITVMSAVVMFTQPAFGYVSDKLSEKKLCVILLVVGGLLFFLFPFAIGAGRLFVVATMVGISVTVVQVNGLMDAWIVGLRQENEAVNYGLIRGTGAGAFAISAQISGIITVNFNHDVRFWIGGAFFLLSAITAITFRATRATGAVSEANVSRATGDTCRRRPIPSKPEAVSRSQTKTPRDKQLGVFHVFKKIFSCKKYLLLLAVSFFLFLSNAPIITLINLLVPEFGGSTAQIGTAIAVMAGTEVPFMFMTAFLIRKFSYKRLFVLCGLFYFIRLSLMVFVTDVTGLILMQLMQGVTFAVLLPVAMSYLSKIAPEDVRASAVTTFAAISMSFTGILANLVTSRLLAAGFAAQSTLIFFAASAFIGFALALYGLARGLWAE
ncbi:MAG: MFS transporter [Defluviitaleaceae bacterium]|nr:MFS transporter [Defluviitaleaceae bacterium]